MAKELPYFRFTVQEWQNGKISLERYELQGLFVAVCGYYWINDCDLTLATLKKRFRDATAMLDELIELGILKHELKHDKVKIDFLLTQFDLLSEKRKRRQDAGSKGGNAKAMLQQKGSYKDKDNNKDKDNILNVRFDEFWNTYDKKRGNQFKLQSKWAELTDQERLDIMAYLPRYIASQPNKKFRKDPATFLNNRGWEDEIIPVDDAANEPALHLTYGTAYSK